VLSRGDLAARAQDRLSISAAVQQRPIQIKEESLDWLHDVRLSASVIEFMRS